MDADQRKRIGRIVRLARIEAGMNQEDLARAMGVSRTSVSEWERGVKQHYSRAEAVALESALGVTDHRLLIALGYELRVVLAGEEHGLTAQERVEVRRFIDWLRFRDSR